MAQAVIAEIGAAARIIAAIARGTGLLIGRSAHRDVARRRRARLNPSAPRARRRRTAPSLATPATDLVVDREVAVRPGTCGGRLDAGPATDGQSPRPPKKRSRPAFVPDDHPRTATDPCAAEKSAQKGEGGRKPKLPPAHEVHSIMRKALGASASGVRPSRAGPAPAHQRTITLRNAHGSFGSMSSGNRPGRPSSGVQSV